MRTLILRTLGLRTTGRYWAIIVDNIQSCCLTWGPVWFASMAVNFHNYLLSHLTQARFLSVAFLQIDRGRIWFTAQVNFYRQMQCYFSSAIHFYSSFYSVLIKSFLFLFSSSYLNWHSFSFLYSSSSSFYNHFSSYSVLVLDKPNLWNVLAVTALSAFSLRYYCSASGRHASQKFFFSRFRLPAVSIPHK